jgi:alcohol-forming fatty acyl-CoA reductase
MANDRISLAVFDFDGTLSKGHLWVGIGRHHRKNKVRRLTLYSYLLSHLPLWLASKFKIYSDEKDRIKWGEDLPVLFKGFSVQDARKAFIWVTDSYFMPLLRADVLEILKDHKQKGRKVMILSGMFVDFLEVVGQKIGADYVVGTRLEVVNNVYSGRIIKPLCFGENKARFLNEFVQKKQLDVDYSRSYAYADSIFDAPVLKMFGNPVATYPEKELYQLARNKQWQIVGKNNFHPLSG